MPRGTSVFSKILGAPSPQTVSVGPVDARDLFLYALFARVAMANDENIEFETRYDPDTNEIELYVPDEHMHIFDQVTGMKRGERFQKYINWLIGSETLTVGTELDMDPAFVSAGDIIMWSGATSGNVGDSRLAIFLPASCLSVVGYNTKVSSDFAGGRLRVSLIWVYDSGNETSFSINTAVEVTDIDTGFTTPYSSITDISTFNLVNGDIRESLLLDTAGGINPEDLISIILRRNYDGTTEPSTDLVGIVGLKVELLDE